MSKGKQAKQVKKLEKKSTAKAPIKAKQLKIKKADSSKKAVLSPAPKKNVNSLQKKPLVKKHAKLSKIVVKEKHLTPKKLMKKEEGKKEEAKKKTPIEKVSIKVAKNKDVVKVEKSKTKVKPALELKSKGKEEKEGQKDLKKKGQAVAENAKKSSLDLDIFEDDDFEGTVVEDFDPVHLMEEEDEVDVKIISDLSTISADFDWTEIRNVISNLDFFTTSELDECHEKGCENLQAIQGFCRLHYIKNWKSIKRKRAVLQEGKLQNYLEELVRKYPLEYIEDMLKDLKDEREFFKVLKDLNIDTNYNVDESDLTEDDAEDIVVETRGITDARANVEDEDSI